MYRSKTINGNYVDAAGNSAIFSSSTSQATRGIKVFGNYDFSTLSTDGYKSGGHNSAIIDTDGQRYLVYHTRFNGGTEYHEVRVHQHGTAVVTLAGLINALKLVKKRAEDIRVTVNGAGAAG